MKNIRRLDNSQRIAPTRRARGGFAFTEVLFAVMVLGIGFIMIAAMFPVTIRQTQNTMADVVGANEAKAALAYMQTIASGVNFPPTVTAAGAPPRLFSLEDAPYPAAATPQFPGYMAVRGNFVNPNNPRIAWLPVYRRGVRVNGAMTVGDPFAQVFVFAIQSRNQTQYYPWDPTRNYSDFNPQSGAPYSTLSPRKLDVVVKYDTNTQHGILTISDPVARQWAAPGAYVVIADDPNANKPLNRAGQSNGRVYQLGNAINEAGGVWDLSVGTDMIRKGGTTPIAGDDNDLTTPATAYMVGRGLTPDGYAGPAQDIALYTGYIQIPPDINP
ncbi:MAG: hypothetical protein JWN40_5511 [Phycisphaerales bacterium]|nr:hypothetical protein [Phycisphaerales bacterium]